MSVADPIGEYATLSALRRDALWVVYHLEDPTTGDVQEVLHRIRGSISSAAASQALSELSDRQLIERSQHPDDGRLSIYETTDHAEQMLADRQSWERGELPSDGMWS